MNEEFRIETPELVSFGYDVAGIGSRFMAALVDTAILALVEALVMSIGFGVSSTALDDPLDSPATPWLIAILGLIAFALLWGYYVLFEMIWNGQSPGKRWVGLRVIKVSGGPISLVDSAVRNLVRLIDFLPAYYGVGVIVMFLNDRARRLGDLAAGTLVVRERTDVSLDALASTTRPVPLQMPDEPLDGMERLAAEDYDLVARFLSRRHDLQNRDGLALKLARTVRARMDLPPQEFTAAGAEEFLVQVAHAYRQRTRRES
jgi:uncharacterized RDD family membrane protein YckC